MSTTILTTNESSYWTVGTVKIWGSLVLLWDEETYTEGGRGYSKLKWRIELKIRTTASGNYTRSTKQVADGLVIDGHKYSIPAKTVSTTLKDKTITSGETIIEHDSNGNKVISVSLKGNVGGDVVGANTSVPLATISTTGEPIGQSPVMPENLISKFRGSTTPILFQKGTTDFTTNGIGRLTGCSSCIVTEEKNGVFELEMTVTLNSPFYGELKEGAIIGVIPNRTETKVQAFEIYSITKDIYGNALVKAWHISYKLSYIPVKPFSKVSGINNAFNALKTNSMVSNQFTFSTDITDTTTEFSNDIPVSCKSLLGEGGILGVFKDGVYIWDNFDIYYTKNRGRDRGVELRYGKNLKTIDANQDISELVNGYVVYYSYIEDDTPKCIYSDPKYSENSDSYGYSRLVTYDATSLFDGVPTKDLLNTLAEKLLEQDETINKLSESITCSYQDLEVVADSMLYRQNPSEAIALCDIVTIIYTKANIAYKAEVTEIKYDVLQGAIKDVTLGDPTSTIVSMYVNNMTDIQRIDAEQKKFENTTGIRIDDIDKKVNSIKDIATEAQEAADEARRKVEEAKEAAAKAIVADILNYLATDKSSGVQKDDIGWSTSVQSMTPEKRFLWTMHTYVYADDHTSLSEPTLTGVYGLTGPQGEPGTPGTPGEPGVSIAGATDVYYCSSFSTIPDRPIEHVTTASDVVYNAWNLMIAKWRKECPYYYKCAEVVFSDGSYSWSQPVADTQLEQSMRYVVSDVSTQYYVSDNVDIPTGGVWLDNYADAIDKAEENARKESSGETPTPFYLFQRTKTTFIDDSVKYGDPELCGSLQTTIEKSANLKVKTDSIVSEVESVSKTISDNDGNIREWVTQNYSSVTQTEDKVADYYEKVIKVYIDDQNIEYEKKAEGYFNTKLTGFESTYTETIIDPIKTDIDSTKSTVSELSTYLTYDAPSSTLKIGRSDSDIHMELDNDSLDFKTEGGTTKAWVDSETGLGGAGLSLGSVADKSKRWNFNVSDDGSHLSITRHS